MWSSVLLLQTQTENMYKERDQLWNVPEDVQWQGFWGLFGSLYIYAESVCFISSENFLEDFICLNSMPLGPHGH